MGAAFDEVKGRATLTDFWALLTNPTALQAFPHAVAGGWILGGHILWGLALVLAGT